MFKKLLLFVLPLFLLTCCDDERDDDVFTIVVSDAPQGSEISIIGTECFISTSGEKQSIEITLAGDFDSYNVSDGVPDWITVDNEQSTIKLSLSYFSGEENDIREAKFGFRVFKGGNSVGGRIVVHQHAVTFQDLLDREQRAIDCWLTDKTILTDFPSDLSLIQSGEDAPYYRLDNGSVYMQVISMGSSAAAKTGEKIYFRFTRYDLLSYMENGFLPEGWGNADIMEMSPTFFEMGSTQQSTLQWGTGIQMPMLLGLPVDSDINLVVASEAGFIIENSLVTPYLYHVKYYHSIY